MKAVVLEKSGLRYTVLGNDGSFRHIYRRRNAEVGEEIEISTRKVGFGELRLWAGAAALFLIIITAILGWNLYQAPTAVALLSVDINPSLQFTIDAQGHLLKFQTQNDDAKRMLSQVNLTGKPIDEVLGEIITQSYNQKFLTSEQQWVVVGYSPLSDKAAGQMPQEINDNQIALWVTGAVKKSGFTPEVAVFPLTSQECELAQQGDLTLGEYALWQTAQKAGAVTQPEKLKDTSERVRLLEDPQVQAQIKVEKRGLEYGLPRTQETAEQDSGSTDNPNKTKEKSMPDGLPSSSSANIPNDPGRRFEQPSKDKDNKEKNDGQNSKHKNNQKNRRNGKDHMSHIYESKKPDPLAKENGLKEKENGKAVIRKRK
ncbi:anti-sigma factor domain-containing protein [Desulfosporosinus sp. PR]|uniref:anti-sigma factor domain-containing protein n=1 Tax=Candidatus Desulfosporosinus nitrosoreducens TaxID=3401928 RepID=UPI0027EEEC2B|nr:anti-sigma factor domain-containing protein [Desulfosporosinus sp. PR]MDQ7092631.1 anti-sigma factor domain-containing protein [Desulfosporosinus sp. PR]